ncbi:phospholipase D-like domain-containing protein [Natronospora cellulosivora (SeqCode)]
MNTKLKNNLRESSTQKTLFFAKTSLIIYMIYTFFFGVLLFNFINYDNSFIHKYDINRFLSNDISQDRIILLENMNDASLKRINMIENAEDYIDISAFKIHNDFFANILLSTLIDAADRGVEIRMIIDGLYNLLNVNIRNKLYSLNAHPNIHLKFYEPIRLLQPWTLNNRLHDKYIIVDNRIVLIGGRNIGDKYFDENYKGRISNDRDIAIINTDLNTTDNSVIHELREYFDYVWKHQYSRPPYQKIKNIQENRFNRQLDNMRDFLAKTKVSHPELFNKSIDWLGKSISTNNISLIHNPIERFRKEPHVWYDITRLIEDAEKSVWVQSPYIIPTNDMLNYLDLDKINAKEINIITNSLASSPNFFASSGYIRHRNNIADRVNKLYEYHGNGSIHAKSFVFDNRISLVGSFNVDSRSTYLSTETMMVIDSKEFACKLKNNIQNQINQSVLVNEEKPATGLRLNTSFLKLGIVRIMSFLSSFFDYML